MVKQWTALGRGYSAVLVTLMFGLVGSRPAATVRMLVSDQAQFLHAGQTLDLSCEFYMEDFNLFQNPILWKKVQGNEESKINIMGNILQPFVGTGRFTVTLVQLPPKYCLQLSIRDVSLEDYGNYTCEVRGPRTTVLASLTHHIYIKSPVRSITISDYNKTITDMDIERALVFNEGDRCTLHCVSYGGCPPPAMTILLGDAEITSQFSLEYTADLAGVKGLRIIEHRTERWTNRFRMTAKYDDKRLQCIVTVPGLGSNISTVKIRVNYAPIVICDKKHAFLGERNEFLRCEVNSWPEYTRMYWVVNSEGTTLTEGVVQNGLWIINMENPQNTKVTDTRLYIRETKPESFTTYTLVVENRVGITTQQVMLVRKYRSSSHQSVMQVIDPSATHLNPREGNYRHTALSTASLPSANVIVLLFASLLVTYFIISPTISYDNSQAT